MKKLASFLIAFGVTTLPALAQEGAWPTTADVANWTWIYDDDHRPSIKLISDQGEFDTAAAFECSRGFVFLSELNAGIQYEATRAAIANGEPILVTVQTIYAPGGTDVGVTMPVAFGYSDWYERYVFFNAGWGGVPEITDFARQPTIVFSGPFVDLTLPTTGMAEAAALFEAGCAANPF